jgi:hypothetical protein
MSVGVDPRPGRLSTSTNNDHVERVRVVIRGNRRLTVRDVADEVGISIVSCHQMFTEKRQIRCVSAKLVPRLLTDKQLRTVLTSVTNCLPMQRVMKTFLRKS